MTGQPVVARGLSKSFSGKAVLADVSFEIEPGDVVGVLGKNGAGKTTLLELMLGFTPASAGAVAVFGHDSYRMPAAVKARVGFVPQQDELVDQLKAADQIRVIRSFYKRWDDELIHRLVAKWEIDPDERIKSMSVGQRQKLSILLALRRAERAYLRYNGSSVGVLLLLLVGLGSLYELPARLVALGLPLVLLGAAVSSYLGLMMTKGLGVGEAVLGASTMGLLMATSIAAARPDVDVAVVLGFEAALALLALVYRTLAQARWNALDWMLCRSENLARGGRAA